MSILWEKFVGDTEQFGLRLSFQKDPDHGRGATLEESLSWGSFQLWVEGQNLCAHREEGEYIESVRWYLLPLLKWLAGNWDALLHEERLPANNSGQDSCSSLRATRFPPSGREKRNRSDGKKNGNPGGSVTGCSHAVVADFFPMSSSEDGAISSRYPGDIPPLPAHRPTSTSFRPTASRESNPRRLRNPSTM